MGGGERGKMWGRGTKFVNVDLGGYDFFVKEIINNFFNKKILLP